MFPFVVEGPPIGPFVGSVENRCEHDRKRSGKRKAEGFLQESGLGSFCGHADGSEPA
jgi:hypothetical protein